MEIDYFPMLRLRNRRSPGIPTTITFLEAFPRRKEVWVYLERVVCKGYDSFVPNYSEHRCVHHKNDTRQGEAWKKVETFLIDRGLGCCLVVVRDMCLLGTVSCSRAIQMGLLEFAESGKV